VRYSVTPNVVHATQNGVRATETGVRDIDTKKPLKPVVILLYQLQATEAALRRRERSPPDFTPGLANDAGNTL
jgi:hypothetical protein